MSRPRIVVRGATLAITRRCTLRKAFLAPWHPLVEQCWLYALADAQRVHGFAVHHGVRVVSHHHLSITLGEPELGAILQRFDRDVSCAIDTLLAHERYDAPRNVFDAREPHCMRLLDAAAQAGHLTYEYLNPVAAGLVARADEMPGTVLEFGHWKGNGIVVKRPDVYFGRQRPAELRLELTPPPLLMRAFGGDLDALVHHMRRLAEEGTRALRHARGDRPPLGAAKLLRMHPWMEPKTLAERGGKRVPTFKIGARGLDGRRVDGAAAAEVHAFRDEHESCRREWKNGNHAVVFPHGTYGMRVHHQARVAEPLADAIVAQPGPTLDEVLHELLKGGAGVGVDRRDILEEARSSWREEAAEIAEHETLDFTVPPAPTPTSEHASDPQARPEPRVRHRFDRDADTARERHPRRLITQRDRRRGRPTKREGGDPPG